MNLAKPLIPKGSCGRIGHRVDRLAPGCGRHAAALCTAGDNAVETYEFTHAPVALSRRFTRWTLWTEKNVAIRSAGGHLRRSASHVVFGGADR